LTGVVFILLFIKFKKSLKILNRIKLVFKYNNSLVVSELNTSGSINAYVFFTSSNNELDGDAIKYEGRLIVLFLFRKYKRYIYSLFDKISIKLDVL